MTPLASQSATTAQDNGEGAMGISCMACCAAAISAAGNVSMPICKPGPSDLDSPLTCSTRSGANVARGGAMGSPKA
ncbi:hypothetical protein D9M71_840230 [compost metagenome]